MVTEAQRARNAAFDHKEKRAAQMYRSSRQVYGTRLASWADPVSAQLRFRNDREGVAKVERAKQQVEAWAAKRNVPADALWRNFLAHQLEFETRPKSDDAMKARRQLNWQALCEETGGETAAKAIVERGCARQTEFYRECPDMVDRTTQSFEDINIVKFFANDVPTQESTK